MKFSIKLVCGTLFVLQTAYAAGPPASTAPAGGSTPGVYNSNSITVNPQCAVGTSASELDINNVRARYMNQGDMFWDPGLSQPRYEVPKRTDNLSTSKHSMFAAAIWLGGIERGTDNVLVMVQNYRSNGRLRNYWPGPIQYTNQSLPVPTNANTCIAWDQHFKCNRRTVKEFVDDRPTDIPNEIKFWPGRGNPYLRQKSEFAADPAAEASLSNSPLANFYDNDTNGIYNPANGDYPLWAGTERDTECEGTEINIDAGADQVLWWVCNDAGNVKNFDNQTKDIPAIGLEIHYEAFAYASTDATNDMTFLRQRIYNRGSYTLDQTYMAQWADPDLGNANDDYVGCDVLRGLGICYNGDDNDEGTQGYGQNPPAIGVDFFRGPFPDDSLDDIDWDLDCRGPQSLPADDNERIIMSGFVYYNNSNNPKTGEPDKYSDFYNYLRNKWRDGSEISFGGAGTDPVGPGKPRAQYMFPNVTNGSDPYGYACGNKGCTPVSCGPVWNENTANNAPADRRFLANNGPFTLKPGDFNECTIGIVWARATTGGATGSFGKLLAADDKAQDRFNECFKRNVGPNNPFLEIVEDDNNLIVTIIPYIIRQSPLMTTETYFEQNRKVTTGADLFYRFQGYKLYQLIDDKVSVQDLNNPDKARPLKGDVDGDGTDDINGQMDLQDGITSISNLEYNADFDAEILTPKVTNAPNKGIFRSFRVTKDAFASSGLGAMSNFKKYYYAIVAYGFHNNELAKEPYIQGVENFKIYTAIPHKVDPESFGTSLSNAQFGGGFGITRIFGSGNSGNSLELAEGEEARILESNKIERVSYAQGNGPIDIKVYNPKSIKGGRFLAKLSSRLRYNVNTQSNYQFAVGDTIRADGNLQFTPSYRLSSRFAFRPGLAVIRRVIPVAQQPGVVDLDIDLLGHNGKYGGGSFGFVEDHLEYNENQEDSLLIDSKVRGCDFFLKSDASKRSSSMEYVSYDFWSLTVYSGAQVVSTVYSEKPISAVSEQLIPEYGISLRLKRGISPGTDPLNPVSANGALPSYLVTSEDPFKQWLVPISNDYFAWYRSDPYANKNVYYGLDPRRAYNTFAGGAWAPYVLTKAATNALASDLGPQISASADPKNTYARFSEKNLQALTTAGNVDIVFTQDKSKWTRCVVLQNDTIGASTSSGAFIKYTMSKSRALSKDINFQDDLTAVSAYDGRRSRGVSWFPGYAIDLDRGVRLNMMFSESQALNPTFGNDLKWAPYVYFTALREPVLVDKSFIYVMNSEYDRGVSVEAAYDKIFTENAPNLTVPFFMPIIRDWTLENVMYVGMMGQFQDPASIPNLPESRVKLRVERDFLSYAQSTSADPGDVNPLYEFEIPAEGTQRNVTQVGKNALDLIRVVPNPYISVSGYENSQIDNRVKIVNLPSKCEISIFSLSGTLVRQYQFDQSSTKPYAAVQNGEVVTNSRGTNYQTYLDWDMKNQHGIPIASGVYIIHIKSDKLGERTIKWFGVLRPIDLDTFN